MEFPQMIFETQPTSSITRGLLLESQTHLLASDKESPHNATIIGAVDDNHLSPVVVCQPNSALYTMVSIL